MKLIIQIPCYNEEATLPATLADLPRSLPGVDEIEYLVIDDGSTDRTVEVARAAGRAAHRAAPAQPRAGGGLRDRPGCVRWRPARTSSSTPTPTTSIAGRDMAKLVAPILAGEADIVVGDRGVAALRAFFADQARVAAAGQLGGADVRRASRSRMRRAASAHSPARRRCT